MFRATDHRLLARPTDPAGRTPGWLIGPHYGKAQLESLYINPHPIEAVETATACPPDGHADEISGEATPATESHPGPEFHIADPFDFQGAANAYISQADDGEYEIELIDEGGGPGAPPIWRPCRSASSPPQHLPAPKPNRMRTSSKRRPLSRLTTDTRPHSPGQAAPTDSG